MGHIALTNSRAPTQLSGAIIESTGISGGETQWPLANWQHGDPGRHVIVTQDWRGFGTWNTWDVSEFPGQREQVRYLNPGTMQAVVMARDVVPPTSPTPIPLNEYAVNSSQVNAGTGTGGDFRYAIRRW